MQRQEGVGAVVFDGKIGRKMPIGFAGKNDARVGSESHTKECCEQAVVAQSQSGGPIVLSIDEVGCHGL